MRRRIVTGLSALVVGGVLTVATLFVPVEVPSQPAMARVELGLPLRFARQDLSFLDPPHFPYRIALTSPNESPPAVRVDLFIASWLFFVVMCGSLFTVAKRLSHSKDQ